MEQRTKSFLESCGRSARLDDSTVLLCTIGTISASAFSPGSRGRVGVAAQRDGGINALGRG